MPQNNNDDKSTLVQEMAWCCYAPMSGLQNITFVNVLRLRQNGRHFPDDIFKWIFLNENYEFFIKRFVPGGPNNDIPALVQIMAWCWPGNKLLSELMMV